MFIMQKYIWKRHLSVSDNYESDIAVKWTVHNNKTQKTMAQKSEVYGDLLKSGMVNTPNRIKKLIS